MSDIVLKYIDYLARIFKKDTGINPYMYFNKGGCYKFAKMLKDKFPKGKIAVTQELMHVVFYYKDEYYDVDGKFYDSFQIIAMEDELPSTVWKILESYDCDIKKECAKEDYLKVYESFDFNEQEEIADFCSEYNCNFLIEELEFQNIYN